MAVVGEPGKGEVVGWMARTGGSAIEAARHFYPGVPPEEHSKLANKYRLWWHRAKDADAPPTTTRPAAPQGAQKQAQAPAAAQVPTGPSLDLPDPTAVDFTAMTTVAYYEWHLQYCAACLRVASATRDLRLVMVARKEMDEVRAALDRTRAQQGRVTKLERTPAAVAAEMVRRQKAMAILAEAAKVKEAGKEREL